MKAIQTKYLGATDYKGSRIKAWAEGWGSATISYPHEYSNEMAHFQAVKALMAKYQPKYVKDTPTIFGGLPDQSGYVFCFKDSEITA